jgi:hypothetical protein
MTIPNKKDIAFEENGETFVKVKWKLLEKIAYFYQFPVLVFLGGTDNFPQSGETRETIVRKKAELLDKIHDLIIDEEDLDW